MNCPSSHLLPEKDLLGQVERLKSSFRLIVRCRSRVSDDAVAADRFGAIKSDVGTANDLLYRVHGATDCQAEAGGDRNVLRFVARGSGPLDVGADPLGHDLSCSNVGVGKQDCELFSAQTANNVDASGRIQNIFYSGTKNFVSREVTVPIVDLLEVIEIQHKQRKGIGKAL